MVIHSQHKDPIVMNDTKAVRLTRADWLRGALELLSSSGVQEVKIVPLAERLGVTSGSFYWHFKNRGELHEALLDYWEREMTDATVIAARAFEGTPRERIWQLMESVMNTGMARYDLAIWHWAQTEPAVQTVFHRVLEKRFEFATWMFGDAGFDDAQAIARARMMVVYMMGESTLVPDAPAEREEQLRLKYEILTRPLA